MKDLCFGGKNSNKTQVSIRPFFPMCLYSSKIQNLQRQFLVKKRKNRKKDRGRKKLQMIEYIHFWICHDENLFNYKLWETCNTGAPVLNGTLCNSYNFSLKPDGTRGEVIACLQQGWLNKYVNPGKMRGELSSSDHRVNLKSKNAPRSSLNTYKPIAQAILSLQSVWIHEEQIM